MPKKLFLACTVPWHMKIVKLAISTTHNKFSAKCYGEFNLVFESNIPFRSCVPVYSEKYMRGSNFKYIFSTLYIVYNAVSK
jgi:hypothetical protein